MLDAPKTGNVICDRVRREDKKRDKHPNGPRWKATRKDKKQRGTRGESTTAKNKEPKGSYDTSNKGYLTRPNHLPEFIMDALLTSSKKLEGEWTKRMDSVFNHPPRHSEAIDRDLVAIWDNANESAKRRGDKKYRDDLGKIRKHVEDIYHEYGRVIGSDFTQMRIEERQNTLRRLSAKFASAPLPDEMATIMDEETIARLRASLAYAFGAERLRFPWDMAMCDLCHLKARATGPYKTVTVAFYERSKLMTSRRADLT